MKNNNWQEKKLGNIATFINGKAFKPSDWSDAGLPIIRIQNLTNSIDDIHYYNGDIEEKYRITTGDILISWSATIDVFEWLNGDAVLNQHIFKVVFDKEPIDKTFFKHLIKQKIDEMLKNVHGSTMKHITKGDFDNIDVLLPSLDEQKKIAKILDKADEIRAKKKLANDKLDEFLKSTFISMFGDPVRNEKNFKKDTFGAGITTLSDYHANGSYEILRQNVELLSKPDYALMIRTTDLENKNYTDDVNYITEEAYNFLEKSKIYGGEIIINKIGSAGKVYFMPNLNRPVSLGMNAFLLRFNENLLNNVFTYYMLISNSVTTEIQKRVKGAVTKTITKDAVRGIPIIYPPMELQNKFAKIVEKVEAQKQKNELVIEQMNNLFNALSQRAFKGEL